MGRNKKKRLRSRLGPAARFPKENGTTIGRESQGDAFCTRDGLMQFGTERSASEGGPYGRLGWTALEGLGLRTLAGRILRRAALPARWQARHMYQLATVR